MAGTSAIEWTEAPEIPYGDVPESQSAVPLPSLGVTTLALLNS